MSPIRTMKGLETCWKQTNAEPGRCVFIASNHTLNERLTTFYAASQRKYDSYKEEKHSGQTDRDSHTHTNQTAADLRLQHAEERKKKPKHWEMFPLFRKITPLLRENEGCWPRGFLNLWTRHDELCLRALIPLLYSRNRLDPVRIRADFLKTSFSKGSPRCQKRQRNSIHQLQVGREDSAERASEKEHEQVWKLLHVINGTNPKPILYYPIIKLNLCFCAYKHVVCV